MPTQFTKGTQAVKGRFSEKTLEEKVQDMSAQVERIKAEIADSEFYRLATFQGNIHSMHAKATSAQLVPILHSTHSTSNSNLPHAACKL